MRRCELKAALAQRTTGDQHVSPAANVYHRIQVRIAHQSPARDIDQNVTALTQGTYQESTPTHYSIPSWHDLFSCCTRELCGACAPSSGIPPLTVIFFSKNRSL